MQLLVIVKAQIFGLNFRPTIARTPKVSHIVRLVVAAEIIECVVSLLHNY